MKSNSSRMTLFELFSVSCKIKNHFYINLRKYKLGDKLIVFLFLLIRISYSLRRWKEHRTLTGYGPQSSDHCANLNLFLNAARLGRRQYMISQLLCGRFVAPVHQIFTCSRITALFLNSHQVDGLVTLKQCFGSWFFSPDPNPDQPFFLSPDPDLDRPKIRIRSGKIRIHEKYVLKLSTSRIFFYFIFSTLNNNNRFLENLIKNII